MVLSWNVKTRRTQRHLTRRGQQVHKHAGWVLAAPLPGSPRTMISTISLTRTTSFSLSTTKASYNPSCKCKPGRARWLAFALTCSSETFSKGSPPSPYISPTVCPTSASLSMKRLTASPGTSMIPIPSQLAPYANTTSMGTLLQPPGNGSTTPSCQSTKAARTKMHLARKDMDQMARVSHTITCHAPIGKYYLNQPDCFPDFPTRCQCTNEHYFQTGLHVFMTCGRYASCFSSLLYFAGKKTNDKLLRDVLE